MGEGLQGREMKQCERGGRRKEENESEFPKLLATSVFFLFVYEKGQKGLN